MKYCFNDYNVVLKSGIVLILTEWSKSKLNQSILYDSRFVQLLVVSLFSLNEIVAGKFDRQKMNFIKGKFFLSKD